MSRKNFGKNPFEGKLFCVWCLVGLAGFVGTVAKYDNIKFFAHKLKCRLKNNKGKEKK